MTSQIDNERTMYALGYAHAAYALTRVPTRNDTDGTPGPSAFARYWAMLNSNGGHVPTCEQAYRNWQERYLRDMHDMSEVTGHWHVQRHREDDDEYVTADLYVALDYAATELDRIADFEHDGAWGYANAEHPDYESAWKSAKLADEYGNLAVNARNLYRQHTLAPVARAPLYRDETHGDYSAESSLYQAATHHALHITANGPDGFYVYRCEDEIVEDQDGNDQCERGMA